MWFLGLEGALAKRGTHAWHYQLWPHSGRLPEMQLKRIGSESNGERCLSYRLSAISSLNNRKCHKKILMHLYYFVTHSIIGHALYDAHPRKVYVFVQRPRRSAVSFLAIVFMCTAPLESWHSPADQTQFGADVPCTSTTWCDFLLCWAGSVAQPRSIRSKVILHSQRLLCSCRWR